MQLLTSQQRCTRNISQLKSSNKTYNQLSTSLPSIQSLWVRRTLKTPWTTSVAIPKPKWIQPSTSHQPIKCPLRWWTKQRLGFPTSSPICPTLTTSPLCRSTLRMPTRLSTIQAFHLQCQWEEHRKKAKECPTISQPTTSATAIWPNPTRSSPTAWRTKRTSRRFSKLRKSHRKVKSQTRPWQSKTIERCLVEVSRCKTTQITQMRVTTQELRMEAWAKVMGNQSKIQIITLKSMQVLPSKLMIKTLTRWLRIKWTCKVCLLCHKVTNTKALTS